jgi:hypothetical protein
MAVSQVDQQPQTKIRILGQFHFRQKPG